MYYRRVLHSGGVYFFTVNLCNISSCLLTDNIVALRQSFKKVLSSYPFKLHGIVVLPEHMHLLMELPYGDSNYSLRLNLIKRYFSMQLSSTEFISKARAKKRERGIWQRRFWEHLIQSELDYEHHMNYILYNPVKHGYVAVPTDWPYSSIHRDLKSGKTFPSWNSNAMVTSRYFGE